MSETEKTYGQTSFEKYREVRGGVNHDGTPTPTWDTLTPEIRDAWNMAANAATDRILIELDNRPDELLLRARGAVRVFVKGGREQALVLTKIDEARHWLADALRPADGKPQARPTDGSCVREGTNS